MRATPSAFLPVLIAAAWAATAARPGEAASEPALTPRTSLEDCDAWTAREPESLRAYDCYGFVARQHRAWDETVRRLDARLAIAPDNHWARFELALVEWDRRAPRARDLAIAAAEGFAASGDRAAEARARMSISVSWQHVDEARVLRELDRAEVLANALGDRTLLGYIALNRAQAALRREDYGAAAIAYAAAAVMAVPDGSVTLQGMILSGQGALAWVTLRLQDALDCYTREAEIYRRSGRAFEEAGALANAALVTAQMYSGEGAIRLEDVRARIDAALAAARSAGHREGEAGALTLRAQLGPRSGAVADARRAVALLHDAPWSNAAFHADLVLAEALEQEAGRPLVEADRLRDRALDRAASQGNLMAMTTAYQFVGDSLWRRGLEDDAFAAWEKAIASQEAIRRAQPEQETRSLVFARSEAAFETVVDRRLARYLERGDPEDLDQAFRAMERGRARGLQDVIEASGASAPSEHPARAAREDVLRRIAATQQSLTRETPGTEERRRAVAELGALESRETELRETLARADPAWGVLLRPRLPSLDDVRMELRPGEILLAFQVAPGRVEHDALLARDVGGSWVIAASRDRVAIRRLPDERDLERAVNLIGGAVARGDGSEAAFAEILGAELVSRVLPDPALRPIRLILVLDGTLHRLPFEVLRLGRGAPPLGAGVELVRVPSIATWWFWRTSRRTPRPSALVVADPDLDAPAVSAEVRSSVPSHDGSREGRLPFARREGEMVARKSGGRLLSGRQASESALKDAARGGLGFLHVAAHAVVDELRPRRSAVILAPGNDGEDGLLHPFEISQMDLAGATVVLSACSSASGAIQGREGVDGLAAAFLRAGARSVIGGLWPLRDADTAAFVAALVDDLERGKSVATALHGARRVLMQRGAPASAWAGLIVIGDGDATVPLGLGRGDRPARRHALPAAVVAAAGALALLAWRRFRG